MFNSIVYNCRLKLRNNIEVLRSFFFSTDQCKQYFNFDVFLYFLPIHIAAIVLFSLKFFVRMQVATTLQCCNYFCASSYTVNYSYFFCVEQVVSFQRDRDAWVITIYIYFNTNYEATIKKTSTNSSGSTLLLGCSYWFYA